MTEAEEASLSKASSYFSSTERWRQIWRNEGKFTEDDLKTFDHIVGKAVGYAKLEFLDELVKEITKRPYTGDTIVVLQEKRKELE